MLDRLREKRSLMIALRVLQVTFVTAVVVFLAGRLSDIGWSDVADALPTTPWYYIFFLGWFFAIPIAELFVYKLIWGENLTSRLGVFLRKRVYNYAVLSYSGEAYLAMWARKAIPLDNRKILSTVKDSTILSGLASNTFTVLLLGVFLVTGQLAVLLEADPDFEAYFIVAALVGLILVPMILRFRKSIIALPGRLALQVFAIHMVRLILMLVLQTAMWAVVLPQVPFETWLMFLTAQLVLTRVPFLPNTDLMYLGLGLSLSGYLEAPEATVAGMFLAAGALSQILNVAIYGLTSFRQFMPAPIKPPKGGRVVPAKGT